MNSITYYAFKVKDTKGMTFLCGLEKTSDKYEKMSDGEMWINPNPDSLELVPLTDKPFICSDKHYMELMLEGERVYVLKHEFKLITFSKEEIEIVKVKLSIAED